MLNDLQRSDSLRQKSGHSWRSLKVFLNVNERYAVGGGDYAPI